MFRAFPLLPLLVWTGAGAQLWSSPQATAGQNVLRGYVLRDNTLTRGSSTLTLDTVAGRVVGLYVESGDSEGVARAFAAAWGGGAEQVESLLKAFGGAQFQADARAGFVEAAGEDGLEQVAMKLTGEGAQARWRAYVGLNVLPESTFPSTRNVTGNPAAPNTIHILSDFQCPASLSLWKENVPGWRAAPGVYRVHYHHHPLSYHKNAFAAAEASECAAAQGKFWPYADALFQNFAQWTRLGAADAAGKFAGYAKAAQVDTAAFKTCLGKRTFRAEVDRQMAGGEPAFLTGTPTVYLNGIKLTEYSEGEYRAIQAVTRANPSVADVVTARLNTFR